MAERASSSANHPLSCSMVRSDSVTSCPANRPLAGSNKTDILVHSPRAVRSTTNVKRVLRTGAFAILRSDVFVETRDRGIGDQAYRAAPKSSAGHSRAVHSGDFPRRIHHDIQLVAAHFIIVAKRVVRGIHQPAKTGYVAPLERVHTVQYALVLRYHVMSAFPNLLR